MIRYEFALSLSLSCLTEIRNVAADCVTCCNKRARVFIPTEVGGWTCRYVATLINRKQLMLRCGRSSRDRKCIFHHQNANFRQCSDSARAHTSRVVFHVAKERKGGNGNMPDVGRSGNAETQGKGKERRPVATVELLGLLENDLRGERLTFG